VALVVHLRVPFDPETQVDPWNAAAPRQLHLLQDGEGAQAALGLVGVEEGVDRRQAMQRQVRHRHAEQARALAQFQEQGGAPRCGEEAAEVAGVGFVHAAAGMALAQVALVQRMALAVVAGHGLDHLQVGVALQAAPLRAAGLEAFHVDAAGRAGPAAAAIGEVQVPAGAAEAALQRRPVQLVQVRGGRIDDQVLRRAVGKIPAGVRQGLEKADAVGAHGRFYVRGGLP
jgi:hypothetical protein